MSKRKKTHKIDFPSAIRTTLRADFFCSDKDIELIEVALQGKAPQHVVDRMNAINEGKVTLQPRPNFVIDLGESNRNKDEDVLQLSLTDHPVNLIAFYLFEQYGRDFGLLYWNALTLSPTHQSFYKTLQWLKRCPMGDEIRSRLKERAETRKDEAEP